MSAVILIIGLIIVGGIAAGVADEVSISRNRKAEKRQAILSEATALVAKIERMEEEEWCGEMEMPDVPEPRGPIYSSVRERIF